MSPGGEDEGQPGGGVGHGLVALVFVQLFFGLFPLFGKWSMLEFAPTVVGGWRIVVGALALSAVAFANHGRRALPSLRDLLALQGLAILGVVLNMVLFLEGLERSTAVNAGLVIATIPVFTFVVAVVLRQERFEPVRGAGTLLAFTGVALLFFQRGPEFTSRTLTGNALMAVNAFCYSLYMVLTRPLLRRYPPVVVIAWVFLLSTWTIPLFAGSGTWVPEDVGTRAWLSLAYVVVFPTVLAYLLNTFALSVVSASTAALFIFLQPLIVLATGVAFLEERITPITWVAIVTTLGGLWLVVGRRGRTWVAGAPPARP